MTRLNKVLTEQNLQGKVYGELIIRDYCPVKYGVNINCEKDKISCKDCWNKEIIDSK